jgi:hypothetical protein
MGGILTAAAQGVDHAPMTLLYIQSLRDAMGLTV